MTEDKIKVTTNLKDYTLKGRHLNYSIEKGGVLLIYDEGIMMKGFKDWLTFEGIEDES